MEIGVIKDVSYHTITSGWWHEKEDEEKSIYLKIHPRQSTGERKNERTNE